MLKILPQTSLVELEALGVVRSFQLVEQTIARHAEFIALLDECVKAEQATRESGDLESAWDKSGGPFAAALRFILDNPTDGQGEVEDGWLAGLVSSQRTRLINEFSRLNALEETLGKVHGLLLELHVGAVAREIFRNQSSGLKLAPSSPDGSEESNPSESPANSPGDNSGSSTASRSAATGEIKPCRCG